MLSSAFLTARASGGDIRLITSRQGNRGSTGNVVQSEMQKNYTTPFFMLQWMGFCLSERRFIAQSGTGNLGLAMNRLNLQRMLLFICVATVAAVLIYNWQDHQDEKRKSKEAEVAEQKRKVEAEVAEQKRKAEVALAEQNRKAESEAAKQRDKEAKEAAQRQREMERIREQVRFVNQYVNTNVIKSGIIPLVAVAVAAENRTMNHAVGTALINRFKGERAKLVDSFFKPPLVSDGLFPDVFNGSAALFAKLEITNSVDALLLARQDVQYSTNDALDNIITANMRLEVITLPVAGRIESHGWTFIANGVGFRPTEARMQAEERILKQIAEKPGMALGLETSHQ
jgi:hypothetical protein